MVEIPPLAHDFALDPYRSIIVLLSKAKGTVPLGYIAVHTGHDERVVLDCVRSLETSDIAERSTGPSLPYSPQVGLTDYGREIARKFTRRK